MAHMTHEEESAIDLNGNSYIIDFSAMQQVRCLYSCLSVQYPIVTILLIHLLVL